MCAADVVGLSLVLIAGSCYLVHLYGLSAAVV